MEGCAVWFFVGLFACAWLSLPVWALVVAQRAEREAAQLRERVQRLEAERGPVLGAVHPARPEASAPPPIPIALAVGARPPATAPPQAAMPAPRFAAAEVAAAPPPFFDHARAEEMVGGLWLQNVGAVLVMLGAFFSIVWGYSAGRLGPGALVAAGVLLGLALAWRGDRLARTLAPIGHALIGVGFGVVYLSIYLGWFKLQVLPAGAAMVVLALVALGTVTVGLRYRSQAIAVLGVIGAFVPQLMACTLHLRGFVLTPMTLLLYLALVDAVVLVLAARAGWSLLDLMALALTTTTWVMTFPGGSWGWGLEVALALLYAVAGLAPVVRLARSSQPARPAELAVIAAVPVLFTLASWPFIERVGSTPSAMLLFALAAVYLAAAWWIDERRDNDDAWRPLTAAATLFAAFALERWAGASGVALAWLAEGAVLVWLGTGSRGGWLRGWGALVSCVGGLVLLPVMFDTGFKVAGELPFVHPQALRTIGGIALLLVTAAGLGRGDRGRSGWRLLARGWVVAAMLMLMVYDWTEADRLARTLASGPLAGSRVAMLQAFLASALWTLQAAALVVAGWRRRSPFLRWLGLGLLGLTVLKFALADLASVDVFWRFVSALLVGVTLLVVSFFYQRRMKRERR